MRSTRVWPPQNLLRSLLVLHRCIESQRRNDAGLDLRAHTNMLSHICTVLDADTGYEGADAEDDVVDVEGVMKLIQDLQIESTDKALVRFACGLLHANLRISCLAWAYHE